jgi:GNAT superfamily N-acetyltransferase
VPGPTTVVVVARGAIVAVGSLHPCGSDLVGECSAEMGLLVADSRQGQGLGTLVVEDLLARALVAGVDSVEAVVMAANIPMLKVFGDSGFETGHHLVGNEVEVRCRVSSAADALNRGAGRQATSEAWVVRCWPTSWRPGSPEGSSP